MGALGLSTLALKWLGNPGLARAQVKSPALVWSAPKTAEGENWDVTEAGVVATRPHANDPLVFFVEKVTGRSNPFAMGVTVGRVETNDIVIDDASVSRFHAWLQHDDKKATWFLCDAESKNGTWVDALKLSPSQKMPLTDGSILRFGDAEVQFLLPDALFRFVELTAKK